MPKFVAVSNTIHKNLKVTEDKNFSHFKNQHIASLVVHEFSKAAHDYPIIFMQDSQTKKFRAAAMLGLKTGENLFYSDGGWLADYKPESILGYPFVLAPDQNVKDRQILVMDEECDRVGEDEGKSLFDEEGNQTEFTTNMGTFLSEHGFKQQQTHAFIQFLVDSKLIIQQSMEITLPGKDKMVVEGIFVINEEAFNKLSDKDFLELRKRGFLAPIYASLFSMNRVANLVRMSNKDNI